jgi:hypothetical protein
MPNFISQRAKLAISAETPASALDLLRGDPATHPQY